jgi:hypothetical protein
MPTKELLPGTIPNNSIFSKKKFVSLHLSLGLQLAKKRNFGAKNKIS